MRRSAILACTALAVLCGGGTCRPPTRFTTVALTGEAAPGVDGTFSDFLSALYVTPTRKVAFRAKVTGPGVTAGVDDEGIWAGKARAPELVARKGHPAPGMEPGVVFATLSGPPRVSDAGAAVFAAVLAGPGVTTANDLSIWSDRSGALELLVREGDPAPGLEAGVEIVGFGNPICNSEGRMLLETVLRGPGVTYDNDSALWSDAGGSLELVVREGDLVPGTNQIFESFEPYPHLDDQGGVSFRTKPLEWAIWSTRRGELAPIVEFGDPAPGLGPDATFFDFMNLGINRAGDVVFRGGAADPTLPGGGGHGIWAEQEGALRLQAFEGQPVPDTAPGVVFLGFPYWDAPPVLSDAGRFAFEAYLSGPGVDRNTNAAAVFATDGEGALHLILRGGDRLPGLPDDVTYWYASLVRARDDGSVLVLAGLRGPSVTSDNDLAIVLLEGTGGGRLVVREGDVFPGLSESRILKTFGLFEGYGQPGLDSVVADQLGLWVTFSDGGEGLFRVDIPFGF